MLAGIAHVSDCKFIDPTRHKILSPKQIFKRLPIALGQVQAGNTSEKALNQFRQIIYSLNQTKEVVKVYNNNHIIQ